MKKNLLFTLVFLAGAVVAFSQDIPFPKNDAVWKEEHTTFIGPVLKHTALCGDTLIGGIAYSKVVELQLNASGDVIDQTYLGGLRSGGAIVRFLPNYDTNEHLLYDFSLQPGNEIELSAYYFSNPITRKVDSVKMEFIAGKLRKVIYFQPGDINGPLEFWMEGIGSNYGLLGRASDPGGDIGFSLLCFGHEDDYLNLTTGTCDLPEPHDCGILNAGHETPSLKTAFSISPNPSSGDVLVKIEPAVPANWLLNVYTSTGRLVRAEVVTSDEWIVKAGKLKSGLYFLELKNGLTGERLGMQRLVVQK